MNERDYVFFHTHTHNRPMNLRTISTKLDLFFFFKTHENTQNRKQYLLGEKPVPYHLKKEPNVYVPNLSPRIGTSTGRDGLQRVVLQDLKKGESKVEKLK